MSDREFIRQAETELADKRVLEIEIARLKRALADLGVEYDKASRDAGQYLRRAERAEAALATAAAERDFLKGLAGL